MSAHDHRRYRATSAAARYCGHCGQRRAGSARFCGFCGSPLAAPSAAGPVAIRNAMSLGVVTAPLAGLVGGLVNSVHGLPMRTLVPIRAWWYAGVWRQGWTGLFLVAAITPFYLIRLADTTADFESISWGFSLYFAFIWLLALHTLIRPREASWPVLGRVALFTVIAGVAIAVGLEQQLAAGEMNVAKWVFGVGFPEELAKALPVYIFVFRAKRSFDLRSYLFIGAVSGLAFGAAEAVTYSQLYAEAAPLYQDASGTITVAVWRLVSGSVFHACMAGITGFFIGLAARHRAKAGVLMIFGLAFAAVLHGLYDNFSSGWIGTLIATAAVAAFVGYIHNGEQIGADLDSMATPTEAPAPEQA